MAVNYTQAARRHFDDSRKLAEQHRASNASHLAGLAAECALKGVLQGMNVLTLDGKGIPTSADHRKHINTIWDEYQASLTGRRACAYALNGANPFANWRISGRYEEDSAIDLTTAEKHRAGAHKAMLVLEQARLEGVVR